MVISTAEINAHFKQFLKTATHVDIATAWVTHVEHLSILADAAKRASRPASVRVIVGTSGNATHPDALDKLLKVTDDLRIVRGGGQLFHPKLSVPE